MRKIEMEERTLQVVMTTMGNMEYARGKSSGRKNTLQLMNQAMTWSGISNETIQHIMQAYRQLEKWISCKFLKALARKTQGLFLLLCFLKNS